MMYEKNLFLDTCAIIWLATGGNEITNETKEQIKNAASVYISPISIWEISLKEEHGLIELPMKAEFWFEKVVEYHGLTVMPLDINVLVMANRLPWHHKDPADRFIIASALEVNAAIVTSDQKIRQYNIKTLI